MSVPRRLKLKKILLNRVSRASKDFNLLEQGDRVMVCISGGKDSWTLLHLLRELAIKLPFRISLVAVHLDQGKPDFPRHLIEDYLGAEGYEHHVVQRDTHSIVDAMIPAGKTRCSLCSRLRRGILYDTAVELGATKMALGHHRDDILETLLLNLFYSGQLKAMPPILRSDDGRNTVIRPLAYCDEEDIAQFAAQVGFPIVPCVDCDAQENHHRLRVKRLISTLREGNPKVPGNMFAALKNVRVSHLLDRKLWDRCGIDAAQGSDPTLDALADGRGGAAWEAACAAGDD